MGEERDVVADDEVLVVEKVVRDGRTAVIVSPGFGAGWSTWVDEERAAVFAPDVVAWIEDGKPDDGRPEQFRDKYGYIGGLHDCVIEWVPQGSRFEIHEYDGSESLRILGPDDGYVA